MKNDYSIFLISNKPERYPKIQESLLPELLYYYDGSGATCFSQLVNSCVESSLTEIVILASDKVYPKQDHVKKIVNLLNQGYGLVALYKFAFFGFKKELLRKIGMFDERYIGGGFEDNDFINRLILSNIAFYVTEEVEYTPSNSSWNYEKSGPHYMNKWSHHWNKGPHPDIPMFEKMLSEEKYNYDLGPSIPTKFLPLRNHTYVNGPLSNNLVAPFLLTKIISNVPLEYINN